MFMQWAGSSSLDPLTDRIKPWPDQRSWSVSRSRTQRRGNARACAFRTLTGSCGPDTEDLSRLLQGEPFPVNEHEKLSITLRQVSQGVLGFVKPIAYRGLGFTDGVAKSVCKLLSPDFTPSIVREYAPSMGVEPAFGLLGVSRYVSSAPPRDHEHLRYEIGSVLAPSNAAHEVAQQRVAVRNDILPEELLQVPDVEFKARQLPHPLDRVGDQPVATRSGAKVLNCCSGRPGINRQRRNAGDQRLGVEVLVDWLV